MSLAACTTSIGRERLTIDATNGVKEWAQEEGYEEPEVVYGDTDSVFVKFSRKNKEGRLLEGKEALKHCIECGDKAGEYITNEMLLYPLMALGICSVVALVCAIIVIMPKIDYPKTKSGKRQAEKVLIEEYVLICREYLMKDAKNLWK